jgi:hypothetical protein
MSTVPSMDGLCPQGREHVVQHQKNKLAAVHSLRSLRLFTTRLTAACSQLAKDLFVLAPHKKDRPLWMVANAPHKKDSSLWMVCVCVLYM